MLDYDSLINELGQDFGVELKFNDEDMCEMAIGDSIVLSSRQVRNPVNVRYAWSKNPNSILYNKQYPAASFSSEK